MRQAVLAIAVLSGVGFAAAPAPAALSYAFAFEAPTVEVLAGESIDLGVYLVETFTDGDTSRIVDDGGLFGAQVTIERGDVAGLADPAELINAVNNDGPDDDPEAFDDSFLPVVAPPDSADLLLADSFDVTVIGEAVDADTRRVRLGTISIVAGAVIGETTTFVASDDPAFDDTLTLFGVDAIDAAPGIAPGSVDVTVIIPEPSTLALAALASLTLIRRGRRTVG